jgi:dTDP-4-dehydrorhamnose 3,5-epimerase
MQIRNNTLKTLGAFCGKIPKQIDSRGSFQKTFQLSKINKFFPKFQVGEMYITSSEANVLRGMHFQLPPDDHDKIVVCLSGSVLDVILDLRRGSNYGAVESLKLDHNAINTVYLPKGVAHGFYAYERADLLYIVSSEYSPKNDTGILWSSFDFHWPSNTPILSNRDVNHVKFSNFRTVF